MAKQNDFRKRFLVTEGDLFTLYREVMQIRRTELREAFDVQAMRRRFIDQGVFIRPIGKAIYLAPSYTIDAADLASLTAAIVRTAAG